MVKDFVWRQFLLFCHRNGLYYGETLSDTSILSWNKLKKVVRYHQSKTANPYTKVLNGLNAAEEDDTDVIVVGTLERLLRQ